MIDLCHKFFNSKLESKALFMELGNMQKLIVYIPPVQKLVRIFESRSEPVLPALGIINREQYIKAVVGLHKQGQVV